MYTNIVSLISKLNIDTINPERIEKLEKLSAYIQQKIDKNQAVSLNFICTHNSRRSHLSQIWAQTMAYYYNIPNVYCYSGGTECTALYSKVCDTLIAQGFLIDTLAQNTNSIYSIKYAEDAHPIIGFSKKYDNNFNPIKGFAAVMTCTQADDNCPFVPGAELRLPISYIDPKQYDNTNQQNKKYIESSMQIATEMMLVFSKVAVK